MRKVLFIVLVALGAAFPGKVFAEPVILTNSIQVSMVTMDQETIDRVLEQSAPAFDKTFQQMQSAYIAGNVTIEEMDPNTFKVTLTEGGVVETAITDVYY